MSGLIFQVVFVLFLWLVPVWARIAVTAESTQTPKAAPSEEEYLMGDAPFINTWLVVGLFEHSNTVEDATVEPVEGSVCSGKRWRYFDDRLFSRNYDDYQDLRSYFKIKRGESVAARVAYAHVYAHSQKAQSAQLRLGADNEFRAWVNAAKVAESTKGNPNRDMVRIDVKLLAGWNRILLEIANRSDGRLGFYARLCDATGNRLPGLSYSVGGGKGPLAVSTRSMSDAKTGSLPVAWREWTYVGLNPLKYIGRKSIPKPAVCAQASVFVLTAEGGAPPYKWSLVKGLLPEGLTLQSDGTIAGTPPAFARIGQHRFTVKVTDGANQSATKALEIEVKQRPNKWFEQARLMALIHRPEHTPVDGFDDVARLMKRQGYQLGMPISYNNGAHKYRWPSMYDPDNPLGDLITPYKKALEAQGIKFGMYMGNLNGPNHGGQNGVILMIEEAVQKFQPLVFWFDWAGWNGYSLDAIFSMMKSYDPATLVLVNRGHGLCNGDWDLTCREGWGAWGGNMWGVWPREIPWAKKHTVEAWRLLVDPKFPPSKGVTSDWAEYLRVQISLIGEGFVANIDHTPTLIGKHTTFEGRLNKLSESHVMQAHMAMADWASPQGIPPLYESYTQVNPGPLPKADWGYNTINLKGDALYLHIMKNPRGKQGMPAGQTLTVGPVERKVTSVVWMNKNKKIPFQQKGSDLTIRIDAVEPDPIDTIIKVHLP